MRTLDEIIQTINADDVPVKPAKQKFEYKDEKTAMDVLALAIVRFTAENTGKRLHNFTSKEVASIVAEGFLPDILLEDERLIEQNKRVLADVNRELSEAQSSLQKRERLKETLKGQCNSLTEQIKKLKSELYKIDPLLAGAQSAYQYIYEQTTDKALAAKAFDSYLLGGKVQVTT